MRVKQLILNQHARSFDAFQESIAGGDSLVSLFFWEFGFQFLPVAVYTSLLPCEKKTHRRAYIDLICYIATYEVK